MSANPLPVTTASANSLGASESEVTSAALSLRGMLRDSPSTAADLMFHHAKVENGDVMHIYVDGEYYRAVSLTINAEQTYVHIATDAWRTRGMVHAVDAYQASASGHIIDHQSVLVTASNEVRTSAAVATHFTASGTSSVVAFEAEVHVVEYRISREGLPFGPWHTDYQEPATDGSDDGDYVVQMRFLDLASRVLDVQTVAFQVREGMVYHS